MTTRRTFIRQTGLFATGLLVFPSACKSLKGEESILGLQLYSLRDEIGKDVKGVISKVADAGYKDVETYGYDKGLFWGLKPEAFKEILESAQLISSSGHYDAAEYIGKGNMDIIMQYIAAAKALGQQYIVFPFIPEELRQTGDDYKKIAEKFNLAGEECKKAGLHLAYHNHNFEFMQYDTQTGYDILLTETDASLVQMEMDLYWVVKAGKDPVAYFNEYPGRFVSWHIKDMDNRNTDLNTEIGSGSIEFKKIFEAAKLSGVKYYFVEQENFSMDPFQSIEQSCEYVKENLLNT